MCVPFWSAGRATYMSTIATVGCGPAGEETCIGCRIDRTPTRWIATLRSSVAPCTSGRYRGSRVFIEKRTEICPDCRTCSAPGPAVACRGITSGTENRRERTSPARRSRTHSALKLLKNQLFVGSAGTRTRGGSGREQLFDTRGHFRIERIDTARKTRDDTTAAIDEKLVEVPARRFTCGLPDCCVKRVSIFAHDDCLGEHRKLHAIGVEAEIRDVLVLFQLLIEVVRGETHHGEPTRRVTRVQAFET